jgi:hypothetical protein
VVVRLERINKYNEATKVKVSKCSVIISLTIPHASIDHVTIDADLPDAPAWFNSIAELHAHIERISKHPRQKPHFEELVDITGDVGSQIAAARAPQWH